MPERFNGTVWRTVARRGLVSSNLTPSAVNIFYGFNEFTIHPELIEWIEDRDASKTAKASVFP